MPLNSIKCNSCGAHINYAVDIDAPVQEVSCRRCGAHLKVAKEDLDPVIRETVELLIAQRKLEQQEQADYEKDQDKDEDTVADAIDRAQGAFSEARDRLDGLADEIMDLTDTMSIVDQFVVGENVDDLSSVGTAQKAPKVVIPPKGTPDRGKAVVTSILDEDGAAAFYATQLYSYCKSRNIKLVDALHDTEWQRWFISTLDVSDDTKRLLSGLVAKEGFRGLLSSLMRGKR